MNRPGQWSKGVLACAAILLLITNPAYAYADPGSGALLWQLAVAALFGGLFYVRRLLNKIREWSGRKENSTTVTPSQDD